MNADQITLKEPILVNKESQITIHKKETLIVDQNMINEMLRKKKELLQTKTVVFRTTLDAKVEGRKIILDFTFKNVSGQDQRIYFGSGQQFDIYIFDELNKEVYRWSQDKSFITAIIEMDLKEDEALTYTEVLDLYDVGGDLIPSGTYNVAVKMFARLASEKQAVISPEDLYANVLIQIEN